MKSNNTNERNKNSDHVDYEFGISKDGIKAKGRGSAKALIRVLIVIALITIAIITAYAIAWNTGSLASWITYDVQCENGDWVCEEEKNE